MTKSILVTGSTDGIGAETARLLVEDGHRVLVHGRNPDKLDQVTNRLAAMEKGPVEGFVADLSRLGEVDRLASEISGRHPRLDVLINNAGVFRTPNPISAEGLDVRFVVNTLAPYLLTRRLLPAMDGNSRVVNLSSAARASVELDALDGHRHLSDEFAAYAQSKLAITQWSRQLADTLGGHGPAIIAINPGSMLGTKMVTQGFGVAGGDIGIGADILVRAALSQEFEGASGKYFDNDSQRFADPHVDAMDSGKVAAVTAAVEAAIRNQGIEL